MILQDLTPASRMAAWSWARVVLGLKPASVAARADDWLAACLTRAVKGYKPRQVEDVM